MRTEAIGSVFMIALILVVVVYFVVRRIRNEKLVRLQREQDEELIRSVTSLWRGTRSERALILTLLKNGVPAHTIFHDLYVKKRNGEYSQIDVVVPTKAGIIVFEVKDYSGWIFGSTNQRQWTQVLAYGEEKYRFYNPVMQNNGHISALKEQLQQLNHIPFYSVIVFYGNCELKNVCPDTDTLFLIKPYYVPYVFDLIMNKKDVAYTDKWAVMRTLEQAVLNGESADIEVKHSQNIRNIIDKYGNQG